MSLSPATPYDKDSDFPSHILTYFEDVRALPDWAPGFFKLGWDAAKQAIEIPIEGGLVKFHRGPRTGDGPKMWWRSLTAEDPRSRPPFPSWNDLRDPDCEALVGGEFDAMCAIAHGVLAVTGTLGEGTFTKDWGRAVVEGRGQKPFAILLDHDEAGDRGALLAARTITDCGGVAAIAKWPDDRPEGWDITDHFKSGGTAEQLRALIAQAVPFVAPKSVIAEVDGLGGFDPDAVGRAFGEEPPTVTAIPVPLRDGGWDEKLRGLFTTPREVSAQGGETVPWIIEGLLAVAAVTELAGKVKLSGKTTLALGLTGAITTGRPFARLRTKRTRVVYLTEQGRPSFQAALRRAGLADSDDVVILHWHSAAGAPFAAVVKAAAAKAKEIEAEVLIVDTIGQWAGLKGDDENKAGAALAAVQPLQLAAAEGLAVLVIRHARKMGGDLGDEGRGSSAFSGAVDVLLSLRRAEGNRPRVRVLHGISRFSETPETLAIELADDGGTYIPLGDAGTLARSQVIDKIIAMAPRTAGEAVGAYTLATTTGLRRNVVDAAIEEMVSTGWMERTGTGKKGSPYLVHLTGKATGGDYEDDLILVPTDIPNRDDKLDGHLDPEVTDPMLRAALETFGRSERDVAVAVPA